MDTAPEEFHCLPTEEYVMNSFLEPTRLTDVQMRSFLTEGYLILRTGVPDEVHAHIRAQCEEIFSTVGNPGNEILELNPALRLILADPAVRGALQGILGPDYFLHPHRHCHQNVSGTPAQHNHKDSYEDDVNVRHHRSRWAMLMYYPQPVTSNMGPTGVTPGSQYFSESASLDSEDEFGVTGEAGTIILIHYDLWHRALENTSGHNRYMVKFLFCRATEPTGPAWNNRTAAWTAPAERAGDPLEPLWDAMWHWHRGETMGQRTHFLDSGVVMEDLLHGAEQNRLRAAYTISPSALEGGHNLSALWNEEANAAEERAQTRAHTSPCEHFIGYALGALGAGGLDHLQSGLRSEDWRIRGCAADVIGDIGRESRHLAPQVAELLHDSSAWVRRNATETLGVLGNAKAGIEDALGAALADEDYWVGHNAALSLRKLGQASPPTIQLLLKAAVHAEPYRRLNSLLALDGLLA